MEKNIGGGNVKEIEIRILKKKRKYKVENSKEKNFDWKRRREKRI